MKNKITKIVLNLSVIITLFGCNSPNNNNNSEVIEKITLVSSSSKLWTGVAITEGKRIM